MESGQNLIDKAAEICGSRYALAKRLEVDESNLSAMAKGKKPLGPRLAARLAAIAGEDPKASALAALVDQEKDATAKAELAQLFGIAHVMEAVLSNAANDSASVSGQTETGSPAKVWRKR